MHIATKSLLMAAAVISCFFSNEANQANAQSKGGILPPHGWSSSSLFPNGRTHNVCIENTTNATIYYELNEESFQLKPRHKRCHRNLTRERIKVEFDWSFKRGYQSRIYLLKSGSENQFKTIANGLALSRKKRENLPASVIRPTSGFKKEKSKSSCVRPTWPGT